MGVNSVRFLDWLGTSSSLTVLNAKRVWVWIFEFSGLGVSKTSQLAASWKGKMLKPMNFDIETILMFVLGTCMGCHNTNCTYIVPIEDKNT